MRVPISWLKEYVDIDLSVEKTAEILTNAGLEVKTIDMIGLPGADLVWEDDRLLLGHILKVGPHPDADRLVLAAVDYGAAEPEVVVTGAPNLFPYLEQGDISHLQIYSPLALEGATLYDGHKEGRQKMKLKGRPLRGIYNKAMVCSEKELGISEEHEGVILMQKDAYPPNYVAGTPISQILGDAVLEIDIIPNIARCASMVGVARELAALTEKPIRYPDYDVVMEGPSVAGRVAITTAEPELNPRFVALLIQGVEQKPSPYWLQYRLRLAGQRPINVVVDVSNYVMLEMGQPNHTFDYDFLRRRADEYAPDGPIHIHTRLPHAGETLTTLDGETHELPDHAILVTDPKGNLSLGGIMGGYDSEIKAETTNVLLEAAAWNFINIRRTATHLQIHTEASFRFSRSVHPSQALLGAKRAAELLRRLAGGTVAEGIIDYYPNPPETPFVRLDLNYAQRLSGLDLSTAEMAALLERLEFHSEVHDDHLLVAGPDYRLDIEGPHDLVEEVCRLYGYDRIPSTVIADTLPPQRGNPKLEQEEHIKDVLVRLGLNEIITYRLTSPRMEQKILAQGPADDRPYVTITNPNSPDRAVMRHNLLTSVMEIAAGNSRFQERIAIFEVGPVYIVDEEVILPQELTRLAIVMTGQRDLAIWQDGTPGTLDFFDLKGVLEGLFGDLHLEVQYEPTRHPSYRPGRTARLLFGDQQIGVMGELHPLVVEKFDLHLEADQPVLATELDLDTIMAHIPFAYPYGAISPYPAVHEDLALVVDKEVPAAAVETAIRRAGGFLLKEVQLFDLYEGSQVPAGKKSLAYHLTFQAPDKTLTDKQVSKNRQRILSQLQRELGATLR